MLVDDIKPAWDQRIIYRADWEYTNPYGIEGQTYNIQLPEIEKVFWIYIFLGRKEV